jgi:hypothetical protein
LPLYDVVAQLKKIPPISHTSKVLMISKAWQPESIWRISQAAIECGEEEPFFSQHLVPKGDIPRTAKDWDDLILCA